MHNRCHIERTGYTRNEIPLKYLYCLTYQTFCNSVQPALWFTKHFSYCIARKATCKPAGNQFIFLVQQWCLCTSLLFFSPVSRVTWPAEVSLLQEWLVKITDPLAGKHTVYSMYFNCVFSFFPATLARSATDICVISLSTTRGWQSTAYHLVDRQQQTLLSQACLQLKDQKLFFSVAEAIQT